MCTYLATIFDYSKTPPRPLQSMICRGNKIYQFTLYQPKSGLPLKEISENCEKIRNMLCGNVLLNDFRSHIHAFGHLNGQIYESGLINDNVAIQSPKKALAKMMQAMVKLKPELWQKLIAQAMIVYHALENKPIVDGFKPLTIYYDTDTFTGRSRTTGFNIQGADDTHDIKIDGFGHDILVHIDWVSVDFRMASFMSGDEMMDSLFMMADPYTEIGNLLEANIDRKQLKIEMLSNLYRMNFDHPVFSLFSDFREWMRKMVESLESRGFLESVLGRRFSGRSDRSTFNAIIQGSVAHAMHAVLPVVFKELGDYLVAEIHDSIVLNCSRKEVNKVVNRAVEIYTRPFQGILDRNPFFPVKISVGKKWRKWKFYKVVSGESTVKIPETEEEGN